jgi:GTPase SAR1 family protein
MYARGAHVCIIVASIVNPDSCDNVTLWQDRLHESGESPPIVVAINKTDLLDGAPINVEELREKLSAFASIYFVSARTGDCIDQLFQDVAQLGLRGRDQESTPNLDLRTGGGADGGCC